MTSQLHRCVVSGRHLKTAVVNKLLSTNIGSPWSHVTATRTPCRTVRTQHYELIEFCLLNCMFESWGPQFEVAKASNSYLTRICLNDLRENTRKDIRVIIAVTKARVLQKGFGCHKQFLAGYLVTSCER
jgi:hypothetical protein